MKNLKTIAIITLTLSLTALTAFSVPAFAHEAPHTAQVPSSHHADHTIENCMNTIVDNNKTYAGHYENDGHDHTPIHVQETEEHHNATSSHHGDRHRNGHH